jgi:hypothetical protein
MTDARAQHFLAPLLLAEPVLDLIREEGWGGVLLIYPPARATPSHPPPARRERSKATAEQSHD